MVIPMVGEAEGDEGLVSGGIEGMSFAFFGIAADVAVVFGREGSSYVFLQQRAPTLQVSPYSSS